jgi:acetolactate synthase-1/2/3 large subunit
VEIEALADLLRQAENPIIRTGYAGRTEEGRSALREIAEILQAPVYEFFMPSHHNFPRSHPLHGAGTIEEVLGEADVILLAGAEAPWHPPLQALKPDCAVVHMAEDPLRPRSSYWGYATTHTLAGDVPRNLIALAQTLRNGGGPPSQRTERWTTYLEGKRAELRELSLHRAATSGEKLAASVLFAALHDALPEDTIFVDEIVSQISDYLNHLYRHKPFRQVRGWHGALGTGLGVALGVKLACPTSLVACIIGDGAWHYNPVPAALGFAQEYSAPLLIVVCNNGEYASQTANLRKFYRKGMAVQHENCIGNVINPMPDYFKAADGYGGSGERISQESELPDALVRAVGSVTAGQTYILDVMITP